MDTYQRVATLISFLMLFIHGTNLPNSTELVARNISKGVAIIWQNTFELTSNGSSPELCSRGISFLSDLSITVDVDFQFYSDSQKVLKCSVLAPRLFISFWDQWSYCFIFSSIPQSYGYLSLVLYTIRSQIMQLELNSRSLPIQFIKMTVVGKYYLLGLFFQSNHRWNKKSFPLLLGCEKVGLPSW